MMKIHAVSYAERPPEMKGLWRGPAWKDAPALEIAFFRREGSLHRPRTFCKLLYDADRLYGLFRVEDRYVRCIHTRFQAEVYKDSCVEFFIQPEGARGYFNFEFNCGGAMLASYVIDPERVNGRVKGFIPLSGADGRRIRRYHSLPSRVDPEIRKKMSWHLEFSIPLDVLARYAGPLGKIEGRSWRGNFYKCGSETSHPHWASWAPVSQLNFHAPREFGTIFFSHKDTKAQR